MIVRIVTYEAESVQEAKDWAQKRASDLRAAEGVQHAYFFSREQPAEAGAIVLYASEEDLRRYKESAAYQKAVDEIEATWGRSGQPAREDVYELLDV